MDDLDNLNTVPASYLAAGTVFENFEIISRIGAGASSDVYKAKHLSLDKDVALKILKQELLADEGLLRRFKNEALILSKLTHENIISVLSYGIGSDGKRPYLVMELIEGQTLEEWLLQGKSFNFEQIRSIILQLISGLEYAHSKGLVHRDLKPGNIMMLPVEDDEFKLKILDFGIAKILDQVQSQQATQTGLMLGSPAYMSPEQCSGSGADHRADIYSLTSILYELLFGRALYQGDNPLDIMYRKVREKPNLFNDSAEIRSIGPKMKALLQTGLAQLPAERTQSFSQFKHDFLEAMKVLQQKHGVTGSLVSINVSKSWVPFFLRGWLPWAICFVLIFLVGIYSLVESRKKYISQLQKESIKTGSSGLKSHFQGYDATRRKAKEKAWQGAHADALPLFMQALAILNNNPQKDYPEICLTMVEVAEAKMNVGQLEEARQILNTALQIAKREKLVEDIQAAIIDRQGEVENRDFNYDKAIELKKKALDLRIKTQGESSKDIANTYRDLAYIAEQKKDYQAAATYARQGYGVASQVDDLAGIVWSARNLAESLYHLQRYDERNKLLKEMDGNLAQVDTHNVLHWAECLKWWGEYYVDCRPDPARAEPIILRALQALGENRLPEYEITRCACYIDLLKIAAKKKDRKAALQFAVKASESAKLGKDRERIALVDNTIASVTHQAFPDLSVVYFEKAIPILETGIKRDYFFLGQTFFQCSLAYKALGKQAKAKEMLIKAEDCCRKKGWSGIPPDWFPQ
ncbi:MAG: protein kinase [Candidatus Obscuribacterales bacterium]|nr:protein kinase [Candidatus Obscuribacterales bacterium]